MTDTPKGVDEPALSHKRRRFCEEMLVDNNPTKAALRAGYSKASAATEGLRLLKIAEICSYLLRLREEQTKRTLITADKVLNRLWSIATANPNKLVQYRRVNCRHCWSIDHHYQWTEAEFERAVAAWRDEKPGRGNKKRPEPQDYGGFGFLANKEPNPACPECSGEGFGETFALDTRDVDAETLVLYAGVKQTKDGLEIKMHDQMAALTNVAKHLGLFERKTDPPAVDIPETPEADNDTSRAYDLPGLAKHKKSGT